MAGKILHRHLLYAAAGTAALAGVCGYAWYVSQRPPVLEVFVLDVPGRPAIFIRTPSDMRVLINGGSNSAVLRRITSILPFYSRHIDIVIATNDEDKNVTGLIDVLGRYRVGKVILPGVSLQSLSLASTSSIYESFIQTVDKSEVPTEHIFIGQDFTFGGISFKVLFPAPAGGFQYSRASTPELLLRLEYGTTSIQLLGNSSTKVQKYIATRQTAESDVIVVSGSAAPAKATYKFLVYSKSIPRQPSKKPANKKEPDGFNVRETGVVKIVSDGERVKVGKAI